MLTLPFVRDGRTAHAKAEIAMAIIAVLIAVLKYFLSVIQTRRIETGYREQK